MGWISDISDSLLNWTRFWQSGSHQRARRKRLLAMLEDERWTWRSLDQLIAASGADRETVLKDLVALEARPQANDPEMWGLIARNPPEMV